MMVPRVGVEPTRYFYRGILSPLRLPVSPSGQQMRIIQILRDAVNLFLIWRVQKSL